MPLNPDLVHKELAQHLSRENKASHNFFQAWKRGVELASVELFGQGTREAFDLAQCKWELCPNLLLITDAIGPMSSGERVFLAAMVSFYDAREGGVLLRRVGVEGLSDLGRLDRQRREVLAELILHYSGW